MHATEIQRKQAEQRASFLFVLEDFIARVNFIDGETPGSGDIPPSWWLRMSELRRDAVQVRADLTRGLTP